MPIEFHRDGPWELPEGWVWARAGDILPLEYGKGLPERIRDGAGDIPVYGSAGVVGTHSEHLIEEPCLVIARKGSVGAIYEELRPSWPIDTVYYARDSAALCRRFAYWFFSFWRLDRLDQSTAVPSLSRDNYNEVLVPIAPLAEQRRIVARIDELFTDIADGEAALARARAGLDTWRRALLKAAVTGELTREWRERHKQNENGIDLLRRIQSERLAQPSKRRAFGEIIEKREFDPLESTPIPPDWTWASLNELGEFGRGKSKHRPRDDARLYGGTMPFIQTGSVSNCDDFIREYHQTYSDFGIQQSRVWPAGTLCITIAANIAKTGILTFQACFPDSVVGLVPASGMNAYYLHLWMQNIQARLEAFAPATAQKNINLEVLNGVVVPLPPSREQDAIAVAYKSAIEGMNDVSAFIEDATPRDSLRQSILKAAFEGRLVAQDPRDEPTEVLLERLGRKLETAQPRRVPQRRRTARAAE